MIRVPAPPRPSGSSLQPHLLLSKCQSLVLVMQLVIKLKLAINRSGTLVRAIRKKPNVNNIN